MRHRLEDIAKRYRDLDEERAKGYLDAMCFDESIYDREEWDKTCMTLDMKWLIKALHEVLKKQETLEKQVEDAKKR